MDTWRLMPLETNNAFKNMAIDEAILNERIAGMFQYAQVYRWQPSALASEKPGSRHEITLMLANSWASM